MIDNDGAGDLELKHRILALEREIESLRPLREEMQAIRDSANSTLYNRIVPLEQAIRDLRERLPNGG